MDYIIKDKTFASILVEIMERKNISLGELSRRSGISKGLLSRYKNGQLEPHTDKLPALCRALGVSAAELIGYEDPLTDSGLLDLFHGLSPERRAEAVRYLKYLQTLEVEKT